MSDNYQIVGTWVDPIVKLVATADLTSWSDFCSFWLSASEFRFLPFYLLIKRCNFLTLTFYILNITQFWVLATMLPDSADLQPFFDTFSKDSGPALWALSRVKTG